jgi:ribosomal protein S18 acetylase RimI-like enzyme
MYVRAEARGTGVADAVMDALLTYAKGRVRQVQLTAVNANARAVRFYQRHGFILYGVEPASIHMEDGTHADEALMWRLV